MMKTLGLIREVSEGPVKGAIVGFIWRGKRVDRMSLEELNETIKQVGQEISRARSGELTRNMSRRWVDQATIIEHYESVLLKVYTFFDAKIMQAEEK